MHKGVFFCALLTVCIASANANYHGTKKARKAPSIEEEDRELTHRVPLDSISGETLNEQPEEDTVEGYEIMVEPPRKEDLQLTMRNSGRKNYGTVDAQRGQFPFVASLQRKTKGNRLVHFCSGSLVTAKWVLTAAHCFAGFQHPKEIPEGNLKKLWVVLGEHNRGRLEHGEQRIRIRRAIYHPNWLLPLNRKRLQGDILLVELAKPARITKHVQVVDLPWSEDTVPSGDAIAVGWGVTYPQGRISLQFLQWTQMEIVEHSVCRMRWKSLTKSHLCANGANGDTVGNCFGDSGGPMICKETVIASKRRRSYLCERSDTETSRSYLCGIVNGRPESCDGPDPAPALYGNVAFYLPWIRSVITKDGIGGQMNKPPPSQSAITRSMIVAGDDTGGVPASRTERTSKKPIIRTKLHQTEAPAFQKSEEEESEEETGAGKPNSGDTAAQAPPLPPSAMAATKVTSNPPTTTLTSTTITTPTSTSTTTHTTPTTTSPPSSTKTTKTVATTATSSTATTTPTTTTTNPTSLAVDSKEPSSTISTTQKMVRNKAVLRAVSTMLVTGPSKTTSSTITTRKKTALTTATTTLKSTQQTSTKQNAANKTSVTARKRRAPRLVPTGMDHFEGWEDFMEY